VTSDLVVSFFEGLCPSFCSEPVAVELLDGAPTCGIMASVGWLAGRWHILADGNLDAKALLHVLFHELAHIRAGDVPRIEWRVVQGQRDLMTGKVTAGALERNQAAARRDVDAVAQVQETQADAWADLMVSRWWPVVETVDRAIDKATRGIR